MRCEPCRKAKKQQTQGGGGYGDRSGAAFGGGAFGSSRPRGGMGGGGGGACYSCGQEGHRSFECPTKQGGAGGAPGGGMGGGNRACYNCGRESAPAAQFLRARARERGVAAQSDVGIAPHCHMRDGEGASTP